MASISKGQYYSIRERIGGVVLGGGAVQKGQTRWTSLHLFKKIKAVPTRNSVSDLFSQTGVLPELSWLCGE